MDSRLIYSCINHGFLNVEWQVESGSEWIHIGTGEGIKRKFILQKIQETFKNENIFIALGRTNSKELNSENIEQEIMHRIGNEDFKLSNKLFSTIIEFNKVGVFRIGKK